MFLQKNIETTYEQNAFSAFNLGSRSCGIKHFLCVPELTFNILKLCRDVVLNEASSTVFSKSKLYYM